MERTEVEAIVKKHRGILTRISEELGVGVTTVRAALVTQERPGRNIWEAFSRILEEIKAGTYVAKKSNIGEIVWTDEKAAVWDDLVSNGLSEIQANGIIRYLNEDVVCGYAEALKKAKSADWHSIAQGEVAPLAEATYKQVDAEMVKSVMATLDMPSLGERIAVLEEKYNRNFVNLCKLEGQQISNNARFDKLEDKELNLNALAEWVNRLDEAHKELSTRVVGMDGGISTLNARFVEDIKKAEKHLHFIDDDREKEYVRITTEMEVLKERLSKLEARSFWQKLFNR